MTPCRARVFGFTSDLCEYLRTGTHPGSKLRIDLKSEVVKVGIARLQVYYSIGVHIQKSNARSWTARDTGASGQPAQQDGLEYTTSRWPVRKGLATVYGLVCMGETPWSGGDVGVSTKRLVPFYCRFRDLRVTRAVNAKSYDRGYW